MLFFFTSIGIKLKKNEKYNVYKYNNKYIVINNVIIIINNTNL